MVSEWWDACAPECSKDAERGAVTSLDDEGVARWARLMSSGVGSQRNDRVSCPG